MRKLVIAALFVLALGCFAGASVAYAGDCCKPKCEQKTCTKTCKSKCSPCKPKCDPCKPVCKPKCDPCKPACKPACKPKCETKCDPCKPKCEPKCKQNTCAKPCKPKCESKCDNPCKPKCDPCPKPYKHPYEACWPGDGMLCDTGCCGTYMPCKNKCMTCETVCKAVEVCDPCNPCGTKVKYVYETVCHEITRPRVIPWWFNENGDGNIYLEDEE